MRQSVANDGSTALQYIELLNYIHGWLIFMAKVYSEYQSHGWYRLMLDVDVFFPPLESLKPAEKLNNWVTISRFHIRFPKYFCNKISVG